MASRGRLSSGYSFSNSLRQSSAVNIDSPTDCFLVHSLASTIRISDQTSLSSWDSCLPRTSTLATTSPCIYEKAWYIFFEA
jgi:hypothetical protein